MPLGIPTLPVASAGPPFTLARASPGLKFRTPPLPPIVPNEVILDKTLHFDYPGSDIILRSRDSHDFRVPQLYLVNSSPVLRERELIRSVSKTSESSDTPSDAEQEPLPVIKLPESGATLYNLLTFIFPVAPVLPSTAEHIMELLAVAQKYQMESVLTHIRGAVSRQDPPLIRPETALHIYFLAQKYELRQETLRAARSTLRLSMTIEDLEGKIDFMPGTYLHELWKYHESVRKGLSSSLLEFRKSGAPDVVKNLRCGTVTPHPSIAPNPIPQPIPQWLGDYIESLAEAPHVFDLIEFENVRAHHIKVQLESQRACLCAGISNSVICAFWDALTVVVHGEIEKAELTLALVKEEPTSEKSDPPLAPLSLNVADANIILRSSDQVNFRAHKSVLAMSSPFFEDLLSLPQPPDGELEDGLPVIQLSEDAGLLNILVPLLYPTSTTIPSSYEKVFALLAACQKYDMASIQSNIRAEIKRRGSLTLLGVDAFRAFALASRLTLIPEMDSAARLTLGYPMTFESLGEGLRSFNGRALCDLVRYRKRCRDSLVSCLDSFFDVHSRCQIWEGCKERHWDTPQTVPIGWLRNFFTSKTAELGNGFTCELSSPSYILEGYIAALKDHTHSCCECNSCIRVHVEVPTFCRELEDELAQALNQESVSKPWLSWGVKSRSRKVGRKRR